MYRYDESGCITRMLVGLLIVGGIAAKCNASLHGWIVTESTHDGDHDLWAVRSDGTGLTQLTSMGGYDSYPHWSPDSGQIAYARGGGMAELWVYDWFSGANTRVYDAHNYQGQDLGSYVVTWPRWSPDGNKMVFTEAASPTDSHITVINADGTGRQVIPGIQGNVIGRATWSPDGQAIVYQMRNDVGNPESYDLWIYDFTQSGDIMVGVNQRLTRMSHR